MITELCEEAMRLLDSYCVALTAFHHARKPFLQGLEPGDPEWLIHVIDRDHAFRKLVASRKKYRCHFEWHGCRVTAAVMAANGT